MKLGNILLLLAIAAIVTVASLWVGQQAYFWLPSQAVAEAKLVDDLFSFLVAIATFIFFGVLGTLTYSVFAFGAVKGDFSDAAPIEGNKKLEIVWTTIPILLVVWIAVKSFDVYGQMGDLNPMQMHDLHMPVKAKPAQALTLSNNTESVVDAPSAHARRVEIEVFAKQWAWSFRYPEKDVTSTELHLPVNQGVRLAMQSEDVIHGFYVPEFRLKQDIIPNRTIDLQFTPIRVGKYRLNDSQFSGTYFAAMQADVYIDSPETYNQWLASAATCKPIPADNQAASEHAQPPKKPLQSGWPAVPPAPPPVVNHPS